MMDATNKGKTKAKAKAKTKAKAEDLLHPRAEGLYCPSGDFYIDPLRPVPRAVITHAHADHARPGHGAVLATPQTLAIMALRLGPDHAGTVQALSYGEALRLGDVEVRLHPAGHVLGSAQVAITSGGTRAVVSGDYKRVSDPTCAPFEVVPCDLFVSEATFALPVFRMPDPAGEIGKLTRSLGQFPERAHLVGAYALGKAQRVIALLREAGYGDTVYLHGAMEKLTAFYGSQGIDLGPLEPVGEQDRSGFGGRIVVCPPGALTDRWASRFGDTVTAFASGWMRIRARARQRGVTLPLVISDHADWEGLTRTIAETGCERLWVTHGEEDALVHWACDRGIAARPLRLVRAGEDEDTDIKAAAE